MRTITARTLLILKLDTHFMKIQTLMCCLLSLFVLLGSTKVLACEWHKDGGDLSHCSSELLCEKAVIFISWNESKFVTSTTHYLYKFVVEAKKRGLLCERTPSQNVSLTTAVEACLTKNGENNFYGLCSNSVLCGLAAPDVTNGKKAWLSSSSGFYEYVAEAKKRGLSCGVESTSSFTKTSSVCSANNPNVCSDFVVCVRGSRYINGKRIWDERSNWIKYSVEARKRGLSCDVEASISAPTVETKTPKISPVAPKKQPETPAEPASSLIDPLHIKKYGKTLHTLLLPNTLLFIGEIEDGDERGFRTALRAHEVDTVVLLSGGGLVNEGLRIANIINDKNLKTYVPVNATCASACSFMFFAGNPKVAHGRLGVHQFYVNDDEKKASIGKVQKGTQLVVADIIQNLTDFGTPASVFPKMFSTSGMYFFSETEKSAFSDRNKITPETVTRINEVLSYLIKDIDNELDDVELDGMPQKTKSTLIQLELIRIGCMEGPVDGIRGEATKSAIELLSSKMKSKFSSNKFSDLFRKLNNTEVGACY